MKSRRKGQKAQCLLSGAEGYGKYREQENDQYCPIVIKQMLSLIKRNKDLQDAGDHRQECRNQ